ncbi:DUF3180 domain-containing protein [Agromyces intestinalis]|uniref:DUF3180 domain-containing protein n=1 Tax=Agromyces intestinalis TaxID=2592652 RepID=A0A5C1YFV8_9MICO|nr:DUF3180 domain-containing protein [Agromyces intestinalis]QEO15076.1 DUF3180 domain-containing protein [Agromyces intestinalis]
MKRTHPSTLVAFALGGLVAGYLLDLSIVTAGRPALVPPISLAVTLAGIGVIVVLVAWPIRRAVKGTSKRRIDPFHAMRVAALAKACSVSGALVIGVAGGIALFLLTRVVVPGLGNVWLAVATAAGAALLLAGGLVAEWCCTLPPDDPEAQKETHANA